MRLHHALSVLVALSFSLGALAQDDGHTQRVRDTLKLVQKGPALLTPVDSYEQFAPIAQMNDREIKALVPELIKLLEDKTEVPFGTQVDAGARQVRHQASYALAVAAGISNGTFPIHAGFGLPVTAMQKEMDARQETQTLADWKKWWETNKGKPRTAWLEARRAALANAITEVSDGVENADSGRLIVLAGIAGDTKALPAILEVVKSEWDLRTKGKFGKINAVALGDAITAAGYLGGAKELALFMDIIRADTKEITKSTMPLGALAGAVGRLGDARTVPVLVELAKGVNDKQIPDDTANEAAVQQRITFLSGAGDALNRLTREQVDFGQGPAFEKIKPEAFDKWLAAAKNPKPTTRPTTNPA